MTGDEPHVRTIEDRGSWHSRALGALLRLTLRTPLDPDTDIATLRRQCESLDERYFAPDRTVVREAVDCAGVQAEWISVPESRPGRVVLSLHGGEDGIFKRPFSCPMAPRTRQNTGTRHPTRLSRSLKVADLLSVDSAAEGRLSWAPSAGLPLSPGRFHRSRKPSDAADPSGPGRRVA